MTFLNPFLLFGLAGTAIPVLLHLLNLRTARRVDFSTLEFLRRVEKKSLRRMRVRQLLLLALRILLVASIAFAMARPALTGTNGVGGEGSVAAAVILDASLSMRAQTGASNVFADAAQRALALVESMHDGDEVFLSAPGAAIAERGEGVRDLSLVRDRIGAVAPGLGAANLDAAVREAARGLVDARHPNREIHVISDFQRAAWPDPPANAPPLPEGVRLFLVPVGSTPAPANSWIESVDHSGQILDAGSPIELRAVVASSDAAAARQVEGELEIDGRPADRRRASLAAGGRASIVFRETFTAPGVHFGRVAIPEGGSIAEDDTRFFTLRTDREVPVLVVSGDAGTARYLAAAIAPDAGSAPGSFVVRIGTTRDLATLSRDHDKVTVLADVDRLADDETAGLKSFLSAGGGLLVFAGPRVDAAAWTRGVLPKFLPGRFGELRAAPSGEALTITGLDPSHSLFEVFRGDGGGLADARFTKVLNLVPDAGTSVLATFSNGAPAIAESGLLPGRVLFFASGLDPSWSDFPLAGSFLPFVHEAIRHLAESSSKEARSIEIGEGATLWLPAVPEGGSVTLRSPSGDERRIAPQSGPAGVSIELSGADEHGFWVFTTAHGDTLASYAVNVPALESNPDRVPLEEIQARFAGGRPLVLDGAGDLAQQVSEARVGREIGSWFLWAAAFFLLAESVLAGRVPRGAPTEASP